METLYAARLEDFRPGDLPQLECACGYPVQVMPATLTAPGVNAFEKLVDLTPWLRCRE